MIMNTIQILGQKTVVADEKESRNSIRPLLEEAGFRLDYEKFSRTLTVSDASEKLVRIVWVKWVQDFERLSNETEEFPYMLAGSDVIWETCIDYIPWEDQIYNRKNGSGARRIWVPLKKIMDLNIGTCSLEYIVWQNDASNSIAEVKKIFTKYPKLLQAQLDTILWEDTFTWEIVYSDSPDTTLAAMNTIQVWKKDAWERSRENKRIFGKPEFLFERDDTGVFPEVKMAAWEIVESWKTVDELWLSIRRDMNLSIPISTGLFSQNYIGNDALEPQMRRFIDVIQELIKTV